MQISFPGHYPEPSHGKLIFVKPTPPHAKYEFHNGNFYTQSRQGNREHHCCSRFVAHRTNCLHFSVLGMGEQPRTGGRRVVQHTVYCRTPPAGMWKPHIRKINKLLKAAFMAPHSRLCTHSLKTKCQGVEDDFFLIVLQLQSDPELKATAGEVVGDTNLVFKAQDFHHTLSRSKCL